MERSIWERRQRLEMEQALLDQAEEDLERRRRNLSIRGNSIIGVTPDNEHADHNPDKEQQHWQMPLSPPPAGSQVAQDVGPRLDAIQDPWSLRADDSSDEEDDGLSAAFQNSMQFPNIATHPHMSDSEESWAHLTTSPETHQRHESSDVSDLTFESSHSVLHEDDAQSYDMLSASSDGEGSRRPVAH